MDVGAVQDPRGEMGRNEDMGRVVVLLDLDETLVLGEQAIQEKPGLGVEDYIHYQHNLADTLRPGTNAFLRRLCEIAHVALLTNKMAPYSDRAHAFLRSQFPTLAPIHEHELNRMRSSGEEWVDKRLCNVFCHVEDARRCILIDDDIAYIQANIGHAIPALQRSNYIQDWNEGLLGRILPLVEGAISAFEGSEHQRELRSREIPEHKVEIPPEHVTYESFEKDGTVYRYAKPVKNRLWLACATERHDYGFGIYSSCACERSREAQGVARRIFSGGPVYNPRIGAHLHARLHSTFERFPMERLGREDPIARYLVPRAYGDNFEAHERAYLDAKERQAELHRQVKAQHDAITDPRQQYEFRLNNPLWCRENVQSVDYELEGETYPQRGMPDPLYVFGRPSY